MDSIQQIYVIAHCKQKINLSVFFYFADTFVKKNLLVSKEAKCEVEGLACADPGARTPIGASRNYN